MQCPSSGPSPRVREPKIVRRPATRLPGGLLATVGLAFLLGIARPGSLAAQQSGNAPLADLVLNLRDSPDPVPATGLITDSISVTNDGAATATGVQFTLTVPTNARYNSYTGTGITCTGMAVGAVGPGTLTCTLPDLAFGATTEFIIRLRSTASGLVTVTGNVTSAVAELQSSNNTVTETTTAIAGADVALLFSGPATAASGATISYALSLTNAGPDIATALRIQFPIPTGFVQAGGLPSGCATSAGTITCTIAGSIASGGTLIVGNISGQVTAGAGSTIAASASASLQPGAPVGTAQDPNMANNTVTANTTVTSGSDVSITVGRSTAAPYFVGGTFNFTLTPVYTGGVPSGLAVVDTIPAEYTIRTGSFAASQNGWTCSIAGQIVTCTRPSGGVAGVAQALGIITIPITIASTGTGITNRATITVTAPTDPNLANNTATDGGVTLQAATADLSLAKTGPNPALAVVGQSFTYTIRVTNSGPSAFSGTLAFADTLPAGITVSAYTLNGWTCSPVVPVASPDVVTCQRTYTSGAPLPSGSIVPGVVLTATSSIAGSIVNSATLSTTSPSVPDPTPANNRAVSTITVSQPAGAADLRVLKTVDLPTVPAGDVLTYTIEIVNDGPATATNVALTDTLTVLINANSGATGAGHVSQTIIPGVATGTMVCTTATYSTNGRRLNCTIPSLPVCTSGVDCPKVQVRVRPGGDGGPRSNTAWVVSSSVADSTPANNYGSVSDTTLARADITVTVTDNPDPVAAGQDLTYIVTATNAGPSQALGVTVVDTLPLGVVFVSAVPSAGSCSVTPGVGVITTINNREIVCTLGTLANTVQRTITIHVRPTTSTRGTTLANGATVATTTTEPTSPGATNNAATANTTVAAPSLDMLVNKTDSVDPLTVGDTTAYTITVTNAGPSDAENVVVTDTLPLAGLSFQSYTISSGSCTLVPAVGAMGGTLRCGIARLGSGASMTIVVKMRGVTKGVYTNLAAVASDESGLGYEITGNNIATQATTVRTRADMEIASKVASSDTVAVRRPFTWTIRVRNNGGTGLAEADTVRLSDTFPAGMELTGPVTMSVVTGTASLAGCTGAAGATSFSCQLGTVSSGGIVDIIAPVRVLTTLGTTLTNSATVTTASQDLVGPNNSASGTVTVRGSSLSGQLFRDFNANGAPDASDTGIDAITMTLGGTAFDASPVSRTTTTDASGAFAFANLPEGSYTITRGTVSEALLPVGLQTAGNRGGTATTPPSISAITLGGIDAGTGYRFAYVPQSRIGVAERLLGSVTGNADGTFTAVLRTLVRNYSREALGTVTVTDSLAGAAPGLGTFTAGGSTAVLATGQYTVEALPSFASACTGGTLNASYDGSSDTRLATITSLAVGASCDVAMTVRFKPLVPLPGGGYATQARASSIGALSAQAAGDLSQNGTTPDPDADGDPTNNAAPTPLPMVLTADVTTTVTAPASANAGTLVTGTVTYRNTGPNPASATSYTLTLSPALTGVTFGNLPAGATATYAIATGVVTLTGLPATLGAGTVASGDSTNGLSFGYVQPGSGSSTVSSTISTSTGQGANTGPDAATAAVSGSLIADVTTILDFPATVDAGQPVSGKVTYRNAGPSTAATLGYTLALAPSLTGVTFGNLPAGGAASYNASTGTVTLSGMPATLAPDATASANGTSGITISYPQPSSATSTVSSSITTGTAQGANTGPDAASASVAGSLVADVTTALAFPASVNAGSPVNGTLAFRNLGPSPASGMTYGVTLTTGLSGVTFGNLPLGATATYASSTGVVTLAGMPGSIAAGLLASGDGTSGIAIAYTQPASAVSTVASTIGTSTNQGANTALDAASTSPGGAPVADVRALVVLPASIPAGTTVNGTVSFSNTGPSLASGVTYALTLTPGLAGVTIGNLPAGATATYAPTTGTITLTGLPTTLAANTTASADGTTGLTLSYTQPGTATSTVSGIIGTATAQGANIAPDNSSVTVTGMPVGDVTTALAFPASILPGNQVAGTVRFLNAGPSATAGMRYSLTLAPALTGVTFGNLPTGATAAYDAATGTVTFAGLPPTLAPGSTASGDGTTGITVSYLQPVALSTAVASHIGTTTSQGTNAAPDDATSTVTGATIADVTTTVSLLSLADAGQPVTGTVTFRNMGPLGAAGVTYTLTLTAGLTGVTVGNLPTGATATYAAGTGIVTLTGMPTSVAPGTVVSGNGTSGITLAYTQPATATSAVTSSIATSTSQGLNAAPDTASATAGGALLTDVTVLLSFPATANAGTPVTGTATFRNLGPSSASNVSYTLTLATGLASVTFGNLPAGATASYSNTTGTVSLAGMPQTLGVATTASSDGTSGITITYTQPATAGSTVASTIATSTPQGANAAPDASASAINGSLVADVTTTLAFPTSVDASALTSGTVTFRNLGPSAASGLAYALTLTPGLSGVTFGNLPAGATAAYATTGAVTFAGMPATLAASALASGDGATGITVAYVQPATASSTVTSSISTSTGQGSNTAPDTAAVAIAGSLVADVTTTLGFPTSVNAGATVDGSVTYRNTGPSTAAGVAYSLTLTSGLPGVTFGNLPSGATATYVAASGGIAFSGMPTTVAAGMLVSGNGTTGITISYTQPAGAVSTIASAISTTTDQGANVALDAASASPGGAPVADVRALIELPATVAAGAPVRATARFSNTGPSSAAGVGYTLTLTTGLSGVAVGNLPAGAAAMYVPATGVVTLTGMPATLAAAAIASGDGTTGLTIDYTQPGSATSTVTGRITTTTAQGANIAPDSSSGTVTGASQADVTTALAFAASADAGAPVAGTVRFQNTGPSAAANVTYTLTLNPALTGVTFGNLPTGATAAYAPGNGAVTFAAMPTTVASGATVSGNGTSGITIGYTQPTGAMSTVTSSLATSTSQGANTAPDAATATVGGTLVADVTAALAFPASVDAGQPVAGTATFRNAGPSTAATLGYTLTLTPGLNGVTFGNLPIGATAAYDTATGTATLAGMPVALAPGAIASGNGTSGITIGYTQPTTASSALSSSITTGTAQGANIGPDAATATVRGGLVADVTTALAFPASVNAGDPVAGTVTFRNVGPSAASTLTYTLTLTPRLSGVTFGNLPSGTTATYSPATGAVSLAGMPVTLAAGATASANGTSGITVAYTQPSTASSALSSSIATGTVQGTNTSPDSASASIAGSPVADVTTVLAFPASVNAGDPVNGTVVFRNLGPSPAAALTYTLTLTPGLSAVTFGNLPAGAAAAYTTATGAVSLTGMPASLASGLVASTDGTTGINVSYIQPAGAVSTVASTIGTSTNQGANAALDAASASPGGAPVADVRALVVLPANVPAGGTVTGTVTFSNTGPSAASGLAYTLALTPGLAGVTVGNLPAGATATYAPATGTVTLAALPATLAPGTVASANGTTGLTLAYTQPGAATSTVTGTIATGTAQGANIAPDNSTVTVTGAPVADITTVLVFPASTSAGDPVNGTVTFRNVGPSTAADLVYGLTLASGLNDVTFGNLPAGATAAYAATTGTVTLTGLPATLLPTAMVSGDGTSGITVRYTQPTTGTSAVASSIATSTGQGTNAAPDGATVTVQGMPVADVSVTLAFENNVVAGQLVRGTVSFVNRGPSRATGVQYELTLPAGLTGVTFAGLPAGASAVYAPTNGVVTLTGMPDTLGTGLVASADGVTGIALGYTQPATATSTVAAAIRTATSQGRNASPDEAAVTISGKLIADVTTSLAFPARVAIAAPVDGTVTFRNTGSSAALGVTYGLRLAPGLTDVVFGNLPAGASAVYASSSGTVTLTSMPSVVAPGAIASADGTSGLTVHYAQGGEASGSTIESTIGTSSDQGANSAPDVATVAVATVAPVASNLVLSNTTTATLAQLGDIVTYKLLVRNDGASDIPSGSRLIDMPNGLTLLSTGCAVGTANQCSTAPSVAELLAGAMLPALRAGMQYELDVRGRVNVTTGAVSNHAVVAPPAGYVETSTTDNDVTTALVPVQFGPDLSVSVTPPAALSPGGTAVYGFVVTNGGAGPTTGSTTVTDVLPAGLTFVSASGAGWSCASPTGQTVTCTRTQVLLAGARTEFALTVRVAESLSGALMNTATVSTPGDGERGGKTVTSPGTLALAPDLALTAIANTDTLRAGASTTYTLALRNVGAAPTNAPITLNDTLPAGLVPTAASGDGFACTVTGQVVSCERGAALLTGTSATLQIVANVAASAAAGPLVNTVCTATAGDTNAANDCAAVSLPLARSGALSVRKEAVGEFAVGQTGTFRLWVRNGAPVAAPGPITLTDTLPRGFAFVAATGRDWSCATTGGVVTCTTGASIAGRDSVAVTLVTTIGADALPVTTNCVTLTALVAGLASDGGRSCTTVHTVADYRLTLELSTPRYERDMGDVADFTAIVRNVGRSPLPAVMLTITPPRGFTYLAGSTRRALAAAGGDASAANPTNAGAGMSWPVGDLAAGDIVRISYRARIGAGAQLETDNVTRAAAVSMPSGPTRSNDATVAVRVRGGVFTDRGIIAGKVYMRRDTSAQREQSSGDVGIPGIRMLLEDGSGAITDEEGKYNFVGVRAGLHVVKVDRVTLPVGAVLVVLDNRNARDAYSRFVDLKAGELARADFAEASGVEAVGAAVLARRDVHPLMMDSVNPTTVPGSSPRPLVATGVLEARVDLRTHALSAPTDGFETALQSLRLTGDSGRVAATARAALYLKGDVRKLGRLTLGYDSERDPEAPLFRDIQPDAYFPVYGDAAGREFDAQSRHRFYMQAERGASYLRYGDILTPETDEQRVLLAFQRSLTGLQHHMEGSRGMLTSFASRSGTRQQLEEIPGRGLSGSYDLRTPDAVVNSERVEIVTRDRNQPSVVLRTVVMERFTDYTIEPGSGRLVFRMPVPSLDEGLNPVSIRVSYEVDQDGAQFLTYGGDGRLRLGGRFELGGLVARDENPLDRQTVFGGSATAVLGAGTTLFGELARTETGDAGLAGDAWHLELRHHSAFMDGRIYALHGDSSFTNRSSTFVGGRAEYGARWSVALGASTRVLAEALRTEDTRTDGHRDGASVLLEQGLRHGLRADFGYRWADETVAPATPRAEGIAPIAAQTLRLRLTAAVLDSTRASIFAEYEAAIDGSEAHRGLIGGDYRVFKGTRLYLRHEWISSLDGPYALNDQQHQENTVFGIDAALMRNGQLFSEYRARDAFDGRDAEASIGLRNRWSLARGVAANTSFERVSPVSGTTDATSLAVTGALAWTRSPLWKGTTRLEWRTSDAGDDFLGSLGYARKLSENWTLLGHTLWDERASAALRGRSELGMAWRETDRNTVDALFRFENIVDQADALGVATTRSIANIATALVNVQPAVGLTYSGRYALKRASDRRDDIVTSTMAQLLMGRVTKDLTSRFDAGLIGSVFGNGTFSERQYGVGGELGVVLMKNARIAGGYNLFGFTDADFSSFGTTQRGAYIAFGFKFDETFPGTTHR